MPREAPVGLALGLSLVAAGCGLFPGEAPRPVTAREAAQVAVDAPLLAYLNQPGANPALCALEGDGEHLAGYTLTTQKTLLAALVDGPIADPDVFRQCLTLLLEQLPEESAAQLYDRLASAYRELLTDRALERGDLAVAARLDLLQHIFTYRPPGRGAHPSVVAPMIAELNEALAHDRLRPRARLPARALRDTLALEQGLWQGAPVDDAMMDRLASANDDATLARFALRLPDAARRAGARLRRVSMRAARSPFPEVRAADAQKLAKIAARGANPVALAEHPVLSARFADDERTRVIHVWQSVETRDATLLGAAPAQRTLLAVLPLSGRLLVKLRGLSREVTVCSPASALDPSPCIEPGDLALEDDVLATLDGAGALRFREHIDGATIDALALRDAVALTVRVGRSERVHVPWRVRFEPPEGFAYYAAYASDEGADLSVDVSWLSDAGRARFSVRAGDTQQTAYVEASDLATFRIATHGATGSRGSSGSTGQNGSSGSTCQDGGNGSSGGSGGTGGNGGPGGDIDVRITCADSRACEQARTQLAQVFVSEGGAGGEGGPGGQGGSGGSGGASDSSRGCSAGSRGRDGWRGSDGTRGWAGPPGRITVRVTSAPRDEAAPE